MQKLTAEQRDYLIEQFNNKKHSIIDSWGPDGVYYSLQVKLEEIKNIINQCTECDHVITQAYLTMPPKYKCDKCGVFFEQVT